MSLNVPQIRKEYARHMSARRRGYVGDIVWSDKPGYDEYIIRIKIHERTQHSRERDSKPRRL